jgi:poly-gamma-glutamate system protein
VRYSPLTTTVGNLEAKRTTTNPNMAGLVAKLLLDAGCREEDVVAIGASGSFPALVLATLSAARALHLRPVLIYSVGASQWGANELEFTWLEMEECLIERGILPYRVTALSLGGDADHATELDPTVVVLLHDRVEAAGVPVIESPNLVENVAQRMEIYRSQAEGTRIAAFVNIGGTWANLGTDPSILALEPGLDRVTSIPDPLRRGVLFEMAEEGIPVIHLLNVKGLATRYGLPWDPVPLPPVGDGMIYHENGQSRRWELATGGTYLLALGGCAVFWRWLTRAQR